MYNIRASIVSYNYKFTQLSMHKLVLSITLILPYYCVKFYYRGKTLYFVTLLININMPSNRHSTDRLIFV